jgi:hypothetical protein
LLKRVSGLIQSDRHTFEVDLEKWPAVRRHSVIEDGISELCRNASKQFYVRCGIIEQENAWNGGKSPENS